MSADKDECIQCDGSDPVCMAEHEARDTLGDEYEALHQVFLAAHRITLLGGWKPEAIGASLADLESAVMNAQDALPYHRMGPPRD